MINLPREVMRARKQQKESHQGLLFIGTKGVRARQIGSIWYHYQTIHLLQGENINPIKKTDTVHSPNLQPLSFYSGLNGLHNKHSKSQLLTCANSIAESGDAVEVKYLDRAIRKYRSLVALKKTTIKM